MVMRASLKKVSHVLEVQKRLGQLAKKEVLVGIPAEKAAREHEGSINNAELLYILSHGVRKKAMIAAMQQDVEKKGYSKACELYVRTHGSPLLHIPPRPVLEPAIAANKNQIGRFIAQASQNALQGKTEACEASLHKAGMAAVNAARGWFENPANGWPPNSPKTIEQKGSGKPMIDTGEMRKAITYVLRDKT